MSYLPSDPNITQPAANSARKPRAIVTINNIEVKYIEIEVTTNHFYVSDTFQITLSLTGQPSELNLQYWSLCGLFEVKIYIGFPPDPTNYSTQNLPLFMTGDITDFSINPITSIVTIHGRDLSGRLIDKKLTKTYNSLTLTQLAEQFAFENNLTPNVENTSQRIGIFYKNDYTVLSNNSTEWDLLVSIAQLQNFVVWVDNETLVCIERPAAENARSPYLLTFQPPSNPAFTSPPTADISIQPSGSSIINVNTGNGNLYPTLNGMSLNLSRTPYSDIYVTVVVPYSTFSKKFLTATAISTNSQRNTSGLPSAPPRRFVHKYFGLSQQQAQLKAQQLLQSYLVHEFELSADLPGDNLLLKDSLIQLSGTNTAFDQLYYPDEITRRISVDDDEQGGYFMSLNAKTRASQTEFNNYVYE